MAKKRVHELARQFDLPSSEIVKRLEKAGIQVKAAASAVDEDLATAAIEGRPLPESGNGKQKQRPEVPIGRRPLGTGDGPAKPTPAKNLPQPEPPKEPTGDDKKERHRPTRSSLQG